MAFPRLAPWAVLLRRFAADFPFWETEMGIGAIFVDFDISILASWI
jgi:hypothetical protein